MLDVRLDYYYYYYLQLQLQLQHDKQHDTRHLATSPGWPVEAALVANQHLNCVMIHFRLPSIPTSSIGAFTFIQKCASAAFLSKSRGSASKIYWLHGWATHLCFS